MEAIAKDLDYLAILRGIIRRHKLLMVGIFLGLTIPSLAYVYLTSQTSYVSAATISIEPSILDQTPLFRDSARKENVSTYLIVLRSRSFSEAVVEALPKESFEELITVSQYTDHVLTASNLLRRWIGRPPTVFSPQQRAIAEIRNARMEFGQPQQSPGIITISGNASRPAVAMDLVNTHIQILLSRTRSGNQEDAKKTREFLEQQVQQVKESLNQAEEALARFQQAKGRFGLGSQTDYDLMKLSQIESALQEAEASRTVLAARIAAFRQALDQARPRETRTADAQNGEKKEAGPSQASLDATAKFNAFKTAQEQLARLEAKLSSLRERYTDAHPLVQTTQQEVQSAQSRVALLAKELPVDSGVSKEGRSILATPSATQPVDRTEAFRQLTALETEDSAIRAKIEILKGQSDRLRGTMKNLTQEELQYSSLRRTAETTRNLYSVLSDKLMAARIREQGESGIVRIIDPASYPLQATQSKIQRLMLMILAIAGTLALGTAFGIEFLRLPVETEIDVQRATGLRVLGSVGTIGSQRDGKKSPARPHRSAAPMYLPTTSVPVGIHIELYRAIRAGIEMDRLKHHFHSILFTSAAPGEGKSSTVLNLSHVYHEFGRRILIIDADLRRPALHIGLAVNNRPGIVDYLKGRADFEEVCRALPSGVVVVPGQVAREDASSLLASPRFGELLDEAKGLFDLVFVDTAPILAVPDNLLLLNSIDRAILVVKASSTSQRDLRKAQRTVADAGGQILGVILNQANPRDVHYYHPRYSKYYTSKDRSEKEGSGSLRNGRVR